MRYFLFIIFIYPVLLSAQDVEGQKFFDLTPKPRTAQAYLDLNAAQVFSTFRFTYKLSDVAYNTDQSTPYSQISTNSFGIGYTNIRKQGLMILGGLSFRKAGASMVYKSADYQWNLQYLEIKAGVGYQYDKWRLKPFAAISPYYAYLLNAKQSVGLNYYDIKISKAIKSSDLGASLSFGLKVALSPYILIYSQYDYNLGLKNIENDPEQYLYNRGFDLKVGLVFSITDFNSMQDYISKQEEIQRDGGINYALNNGNNTPMSNPRNVSNQSSSEKNSLLAKSIESVYDEKNVNQNDGEKILTPGTVGWGSNTKNSNKGKGGANNLQSEALTSSNSNSNLQQKNIQNKQSTVAETSKSGNSKQSKNSQAETEKKETKEPETKDKNKVEFRIQLTTTKNLLNDSHPLLKKSNGSNIDAEKGKDGLTRYYLGSYETYEEAKSDLSEVKAMGIATGCFIVAFQNGKKITVAQAKALVKQN